MNRLAILDVATAEMRFFDTRSSAMSEDHQQRIQHYLQETQTKPSRDIIRWSGAFVNWVLRQTGYKGTNSAAALSFLHWGITPEQPTIGCIAVLKLGDHAWQGHVGIYVGKDAQNNILCLGAHHRQGVCVSAHHPQKLLDYKVMKQQ